MPSGSVVVYEEAGVTLGHRDWQSLANRMIHYVLQTFRHRNLIVIFTVPDFSFFDASARKLMHCRAETNGIDRDKNQVILKPYFLSVSQSTGKVYNIFLRYSGGSQVGGGSFRKLKMIKAGLPSRALLRDYEAKKRAFTDRLNREISEQFTKKEEPKEETAPELRDKILAQLTQRQQEFVLALEKGATLAQLQSELGYVSDSGIYQKRSELRRRGFRFKRTGKGADAVYTVIYPSSVLSASWKKSPSVTSNDITGGEQR